MKSFSDPGISVLLEGPFTWLVRTYHDVRMLVLLYIFFVYSILFIMFLFFGSFVYGWQFSLYEFVLFSIEWSVISSVRWMETFVLK